MRETLLVTGANGIVGVELVRSLLCSPHRPRLRLLLRGTAEAVAAKRDFILAWARAPFADPDDVEVVRGDVSAHGLALDADHAVRLRSQVTSVIHAAADTRFSQSHDDAYLRNVLGTKHVLEFARTCRATPKVGFVSTAFVAGARCGTIAEDAAPADGPFFNEYERSKALAEALAAVYARELPIAVYRPSIVVGRRSDGHLAELEGPYTIFRLAHEGLLAMIPGDPGAPLDLVPADFVAEAITWLMMNAFRPGSIYHVCSGPTRSLALGEVLPLVMDRFGALDPTWPRHGYPVPITAEPAVFAEFADTIARVGNPRLREVVARLEAFTRQLEAPKSFRTDALERDFPGAVIPHARDWLPTLIDHAVSVGFRGPRRALTPARAATCEGAVS